jgi:hypothetical protein
MLSKIKKMKLPNLSLKHVSLFTCLILLMIAVPAMAAVVDSATLSAKVVAFMEGYSQTSFEQMTEAYGAFQGFLTTNLYTFPQTMKSIMVGFSLLFVALHGFILIYEEAKKADLSQEFWQRTLLTIGFTLIAIFLIGDFFELLYKLGDLIIQKINLVIASVNTIKDATIDITKGGNPAAYDKVIKGLETIPMLEGLGNALDPNNSQINYYNLQSLGESFDMLTLIAWAPIFVCLFLTYTAVLEIKLRQMFAPLAVASIFSDGLRGSAVRYIKKYLACMLRIAIYFGIAAIGTFSMLYFYNKVITSSVVIDGLNMDMVLMLGSPVVTALMMMQSSGIADELVGV